MITISDAKSIAIQSSKKTKMFILERLLKDGIITNDQYLEYDDKMKPFINKETRIHAGKQIVYFLDMEGRVRDEATL